MPTLEHYNKTIQFLVSMRARILKILTYGNLVVDDIPHAKLLVANIKTAWQWNDITQVLFTSAWIHDTS